MKLISACGPRYTDIYCPKCKMALEVEGTHEYGNEIPSGEGFCPNCETMMRLDYEQKIIYTIVEVDGVSKE